MKNLKTLLVLTFCVFLSASAGAGDFDGRSGFARDSGALGQEGPADMALALAGNDIEKGRLELFLKNTDSKHAADEALARELNKIEPSAGVRFRVEF